MEEKNNSSLYILSIVGVVVIGAGIWWLLQQSDVPAEPETSAEVEDANEPESLDTDSDADSIPDEAESGDTAEVDSSTDVDIDSVGEVSGDAAIEVAPDDMEPLVINMDSAMFFFDPSVIRAKVGQTVIVNITADGDHDFVIDELEVNTETPDGTTTRVEFTADEAGAYEFYCSVGSHRERGQKGTLIVEEA